MRARKSVHGKNGKVRYDYRHFMYGVNVPVRLRQKERKNLKFQATKNPLSDQRIEFFVSTSLVFRERFLERVDLMPVFRKKFGEGFEFDSYNEAFDEVTPTLSLSDFPDVECVLWCGGTNRNSASKDRVPTHAQDDNGHLKKVRKRTYGLWTPYNLLAHRISFRLFRGRMPSNGRVSSHLCHNPLCVNPKHITEETHRENILRSSAANRLHRYTTQELIEKGTLVYGFAGFQKVHGSKFESQVRRDYRKGMNLRQLQEKYNISRKIAGVITRRRTKNTR